ncbi:nucleotidyltransferase family protein [candidate division KSB1 bacterium]|nr:nucleotidyltransferase family protein [candidate division KSB1 bacterium]
MNKRINSKKDVLSIIQQNRKSIKTLGVKKLGLFGSFVREEQNKNSDIDLMVEFDKGKKTFDNFMQLSFLLEDLLGKKIELVTTDSMSPYIRPYILKEVEYVNFTS